MAQIVPETSGEAAREKASHGEQSRRRALQRDRRSRAPDRRARLWSTTGRFAAELAIVVAGVLIALALDAYYGDQRDAARRQAYLHQLAADLVESDSIFTEALAKNDAMIAQYSRLLASFAAPDPPTDSAFRNLLPLDFGTADPITGAARALVVTGDINLIREDSLRSAVIRLVDRSDAYNERSRRIEWDWILPAFLAVYREAGPSSPDFPFYLPADRLLDNRALFVSAGSIRSGLRNLSREQRTMLAEIRAAHARVAQALETQR